MATEAGCEQHEFSWSSRGQNTKRHTEHVDNFTFAPRSLRNGTNRPTNAFLQTPIHIFFAPIHILGFSHHDDEHSLRG